MLNPIGLEACMRRHFITIPLVLTLLALGTLPAHAQRRRPVVERSDHGGRGFFMIGAQQLDLDELNERLGDAGHPDFDDVALTLGGGGFFRRGRLILGGEGHGVIGSSETTADGDLRTGLAGGYGLLNLGFAVVEHSGLLVYPLVGVGGGGMSLSIDERSTPSFDDILDDPRRGVRLNQAQFLLSAGVGVDQLFGGGRGGIAVGLRAGWTFAPLDSEWSFSRNDVADGPEGGFDGGFIRLSVGGGRR
jgi:opacity protein-like surface antigen